MASAPTAKAPRAKAPKASAAAEKAGLCGMSERAPVATVGIDLIMRVHAGTQADAGAHRGQGHPAAAQIIDPQTGNHIEAAFHAGKALEQALVVAQIVDQGEAFGGIATHIEAHGRPAPIDLSRIAGLADQPARAITEADHKGA